MHLPHFHSSFIVRETMAAAFSISTEKDHEETSAFLNRIKDDIGKLMLFLTRSTHYLSISIRMVCSFLLGKDTRLQTIPDRSQ